MPSQLETERILELNTEVKQKIGIEIEPTIELLGGISERFDKYGPLGEPSFRRPA